jgi:hypothetical protein
MVSKRLVGFFVLAIMAMTVLPVLAADVVITDRNGKIIRVRNAGFHQDGIPADERGGIPVNQNSGKILIAWEKVKEIQIPDNQKIKPTQSGWGNAPYVVAPATPPPTANRKLLPPGMENEDSSRNSKVPAQKPVGYPARLIMANGQTMEVEIAADAISGEIAGEAGRHSIVLGKIDKVVPAPTVSSK